MEPCIEHSQKGDSFGYGRRSIAGKLYRTHRVVYCEHYGVSLDSIRGSVVRHVCDNPRCINPTHLVLGTQLDNIQDRVDRGRTVTVTGESHANHKLTTTQVLEIRERYASSNRPSQRVLAAEYRVSQSQIRNVVLNRQRIND